MRAFWIGLTVALLLGAVGGAAWWALSPQAGSPLSAQEQAALLQRANLPADFPIHPAARRMPQAAQGGLSYAVNSAVPDVATWLRDQLRRTGYQVDAAELEGDPEADYKDRWISFVRLRNGVRSTGWVIVRQTQLSRLWRLGMAQQSTEVKVLSEQDERLRPAPTPTRMAITPAATPARNS